MPWRFATSTTGQWSIDPDARSPGAGPYGADLATRPSVLEIGVYGKATRRPTAQFDTSVAAGPRRYGTRSRRRHNEVRRLFGTASISDPA